MVDETVDERDEGSEEDPGVPTKRELQHPIGHYSDGDRSWLSAETDDELRDEAAERAARAAPRRGRRE